MKVVYKNGQKYIITDALYEAGKKMNNYNQLSLPMGLPSDTDIENAYKKIYMKVYNIILQQVKKTRTISNIKKKLHNDIGEATKDSIGRYYYEQIVNNQNIKNQIIKSVKDDVNKPVEQSIFDAMTNYIYIDISNRKSEISQYLISKLNNGVSTTQMNSLLNNTLKSLQPYVSDYFNNSTDSKKSQNRLKNNETLTIYMSYYRENEPNDIIDFQNSSIDMRKDIISFVENSVDYQNIKEKYIKSELKVSVGQSKIEVIVKYSGDKNISDQDVHKTLVNEIIVAGQRIVQKYPQVFNLDKNIKMKMVVDGTELQDIDVSSYKGKYDEKNRGFHQIPELLNNTNYDINKHLKDFFIKYREGIQNKTINYAPKDQEVVDVYNTLVDTTAYNLSQIYEQLNNSAVDNANWGLELAQAFVNNNTPINPSTDNEKVLNTIYKVLYKKSEKTENNFTHGELAKLFYKMKKILDEIEVNDFYAIDNFSDEELTTNNIPTKIEIIKQIFNPNNPMNTEQNRTEDAAVYDYLYQEYIYVKLLSNIYNGMIGQELKKMSHSEIEKLKKEIQSEKESSKETIRNNVNFKSFVKMIGHKPNAMADKKEYNEQYHMINNFAKEMKRIESLIIRGMKDYGIFSAEIDIRPIKFSKYDKILKNDYIANSKIKDAAAYSYLTMFYEDLQKEKIKELNGADKKLKDTVEHIVPTDKEHQITFKFISESLMKELLIFTNIDMQDIIAAFNENDALLKDFKIGTLRYATEGKGDKVVNVPIISKAYNTCIGIFRVRKIFAKTRHSADKLFKHDFFKKVFNTMKKKR